MKKKKSQEPASKKKKKRNTEEHFKEQEMVGLVPILLGAYLETPQANQHNFIPSHHFIGIVIYLPCDHVI